MNIISKPEKESWPELLKRPTQDLASLESIVEAIFEEVRNEGDKAVLKYTEQFDGIKLEHHKVSRTEIEKAKFNVSKELKEAISHAKDNIEKFHAAQVKTQSKTNIAPGLSCWQEQRPIQKVGLYIPGGTAALFSSVLMLAVPAKLAGCEEIILCSPPNKNGLIADEILYTADLCGVKDIYKIGGIQAIAAMTFGTKTIPKTFKIFGPGNQYVTVAKQLATKYGVAIDMPAGPSELLVFADESANASFIASDLLSQAEHGTDSQVILVSTSKQMIKAVIEQVELQIIKLPRKSIAQQAINNSKFIFVESDEMAIDLINEYAPEHFIVCSKNEDFFINELKNAGSVFLGNYTPESAGDYASGTNHTLPTNGFSKAYSGVDLSSFTKSISFQKITKDGLKNLGKTVELMAEAEGLFAHKNAVSIRLLEK